ncbi:hypothetical protein VTI74DRAFT_9011 [Chaetomium olivicolor]
MAAYEGNVDRYHRLRRPKMVHGEEEAAIRGIYHSTSFAKFWHTDEDGCATDWRPDAAVMARFIMVNDLSCIPEGLDDTGRLWEFPTVIWHPLLPREETLQELVRRRPNNASLRESVAIACIAADYFMTYVVLNMPPSLRLWQQALKSPNPFYAEDLKEKAACCGWPGVVKGKLPEQYGNWYGQQALDMAPTTTLLIPIERSHGIVEEVGCVGMYERWELEANAASWKLYMCASEELRDKVDREPKGYLRLYSDCYSDFDSWYYNLPWRKNEGAAQDKGDTETGVEKKEA